MRADQKKFGKAAWAAAVERMEKLQYAVSKETLQLMRAKEICLEQKKHALKEEVIFHADKQKNNHTEKTQTLESVHVLKNTQTKPKKKTQSWK